MSEKKQKLSISDIWYYYKVHFIVAVAVILAIVYTVYTAVTKIEPDFTFDVICDNGITYESADLLGQLVETGGIAEDIDGDGRTSVTVNVYPSGLSGENTDPGFVQIVQLRMAVGESPIILTEPKVLDMYDESGVFIDITELADSCGIADTDRITDKNGAVIGVKTDNSPMFADNGIVSQNLYLTLRQPSLDIQKKDELMRQFDNAEAVAKYILKGNR